MDRKTCFVISPIGSEGSDIRIFADELYDLLILPALEKFNFEVTRADKLTSSTSITADIIQLVQNSDLCIIDLTGKNPNVMYECGRRHESGKPFVMLANKGESLPFDLTTIRTIFYELDNPRKVRDSILLIQSFIENLIKDGFSAQSSGESLTAIAESLSRIERKIESFNSPLFKVTAKTNEQNQNLSVHKILSQLSANDAFEYSLKIHDIELGENLLPYLEKSTNFEKFIYHYVTTLASRGSHKAALILEEIIPQVSGLDLRLQKEIFGSLISYYSRTDLESRGIELLQSLLETQKDLSDTDKAFFLNQKSRLYFGISNFKDAENVLVEALKLAPNDRSYLFNYTKVLLAQDKVNEAEESAEKVLYFSQEQNKFDSDHLETVIYVFKKTNNQKRLQEALQKLQEINPLKFSLLE